MAELRAETRYAKQMFLYGSGDGQPIRNAAKLAKVSGVHVETIRRHLPEWEKEAEQLLANTSEIGLAVRLSKETLEQHNNDMIHLRDQLNQVKFEIDRLEDITAKLEDWMDKFDADEVNDALSIFDAWQRACGSKASLRSQFLAMQKQWTSLSGIVDLKDISVVREKEISKGRAKLEIKRLENETNPVPRQVPGGVFSRPARLLESSETDPED